MAANEISLKFKVTSDGTLKMITKDTEKAKKATDDLVNSRNRYNRGEKGVAGATNNTTRGFSKMRDSITGSGGLVAAYATLAANVFALSAVFSTLRRAAEVDQLRKGLVELGTISGLAMESLSRGLVEATGNALSLEEAMRATAQVTSSGLDPSTLNAFGKAAKNISITLGRDVSDSFDRLTRGVTKLEPELLDELGLFVRVDEATQKYATQLGKASGDLTNFERRQAFANEALLQAQEKFGAIGDSVDTNAYAKLAAAVSDLTKDFVSFINSALVPVVELLSRNPGALFATIGVFGGKVIASAVANFGSFDAAAEKSSEKAKKIGTKVGEMGEKLNTTSKGMRKLSKALQDGTADNKKFEAGFKSITQSVDYYDRALKAGTVTQEVYKERIRANIILTQQYAKAQSALTLSTANSTAQTALLALQQGEYGVFLQKTKEALNQGLKAVKESTVAMGENSIATVINSKAKVLGAKITDFYSAAKSRLTAAVTLATTSLMKFGIVSKTVDVIKKVSATVTTFLAGANVVLATTLTLAGGAALFLGSALLIALPLISLIALAATMAGDAFNWFMSFFRSDDENKLVKELEDADSLMEELTASTDQVNKFFEEQESKLTGTAEAYESLGNILSQVSAKYTELSTNPAFNDQKRANFLGLALQDNVVLQEAVAKAAGLEAGERIKSVKELQKMGMSQKDAVALVSAAVEKTKNLALANTAVTKAVEEGRQAAAEFMNELTPKTSLDNITGSFDAINIAVENAVEQAEGNATEITKILKEKLSPEQLILIGIDPSLDSKLSDTDTKIKQTFKSLQQAYLTNPTDQKAIDDIQDSYANLLSVRKKLVAQQKKQNTGLVEGVRSASEQLKAAQRVAREGKLAVKAKQTELKVEKARRKETFESLEEQQNIRDEIQETIANNALQEQGIYRTIFNTLADTKENEAVRSFLQAKITQLSQDEALARASILTEAQKAEEQGQRNLKNVQARIAIQRQLLEFDKRSLELSEKRATALNKQARALDLLKAAEQGRDLTSEEQLISKQTSTAIKGMSSDATKTFKQDVIDVATILESRLGSALGFDEAAKIVQRDLRQNNTSVLAEQLVAENNKRDIRKEAIKLEYLLLEAQYQLLSAQIKTALEMDKIQAGTAEDLTTRLDGAIAKLGTQRAAALANVDTETDANLVNMFAESRAADARVEEERRIQVRDALLAQGDRMMEQDREFQGLAIKRNAFEQERQALLQRIKDIKAEEVEGGPPSQALMAAEAALQENISQQLAIRAEQIESLIAKARELGVPGLESITAQTASEIVPEVPGAETGQPGEGTSATGADPGLSMSERVGALREEAAAMTTVLSELGPEGAAMQTALNGAMTLADTFATAFDSIGEGGLSMQEGLQAAGAVVSALGAMQQAQAQAAVAGVDKQIEAEKKRDGKSKESLAKIAALEKKKEKIERKAFEQKKKAQMASVIISTASAIMKESEKGFPAALPGIIMFTALGAAQLGIISKQTYQGGGSGGPSGPSKISVGNRQNTVDMARANSPSGELAYARGESGVGSNMTNYTPTGAFGGVKYRANGGNTAFMVGEQGPELFVPETPGTILPNDETVAPAGVTNVNFSINAVDGQSVEQMLLTQRGNIIGMIREAANGSGESFLESVNVLSDQYQTVER